MSVNFMDKEKGENIKRVGPERRWQDSGFGILVRVGIVWVRVLQDRCDQRTDSLSSIYRHSAVTDNDKF